MRKLSPPLRRDLDIFLIGSVCALLSVLWLDRILASGLSLESLPGDVRKIVSLSEVFAFGVTVGIFMLIAARLDLRGWRVLPRLALSAFGAGMAANLIKLLVVRTRPNSFDFAHRTADSFQGVLVDGLNLSSSQLQSFPSAHTATGFGFAIGLTTLYPKGGFIFFACAALAGLQRISSGAHFPSDVIVGAMVGLLVAGWVNRGQFGHMFSRLENKRRLRPENSALVVESVKQAA